MSWDILILKFDGPPPPVDELPDDFKADELGEVNHVRNLISQSLPAVDWSDPSWGMFDGGSFTIEFSLGSKDVVDSFMLLVRGRGDAISAVVRMCRPHGWSAYDISTGEFINLENPSDAGWKAFQEFRERVSKE